jgi:HK97 gp10 family phage protein
VEGLVALELVGVRELAAKLDKLSSKASGQVLRKAANQAVKPVLAAARARIPVNRINALHKTYKGRDVAPGFAQRSVAAKVSLSRDKRAVFAAMGVKREAFYATQFVEVGTSKQAKQPWLVPAFEATQSQQLTAFSDVLRKEILKVARDK